MADSAAFEHACASLEQLTPLSRLEARGTIRIVLKEAGFAPASVTASDLRVLFRAVLPQELAARGVVETENVRSRFQPEHGGPAVHRPGLFRDRPAPVVPDLPRRLAERHAQPNIV